MEVALQLSWIRDGHTAHSTKLTLYGDSISASRDANTSMIEGRRLDYRRSRRLLILIRIAKVDSSQNWGPSDQM